MIGRLRAWAVRAALFPPTSLDHAVAAMEFVQYDPIRRPARAQDLILRHRVRGYRAGDLDQAYVTLGLDEGYLHVYGAMTRWLRTMVDPRSCGEYVPSGLTAEVLALVRARGAVHQRDVAAALGRTRARNAWGTTSSATTCALDTLHRHWLIRVAHRAGGMKCYTAMPPPVVRADPAERAGHVTLHLARALSPISLPSLRSALVMLRRRGGLDATRCPDLLVGSGELIRRRVDGLDYVWPADAPDPDRDLPTGVRLLAPFDPLVWDRRRFAHLWRWPYRFEAYTPAARRRFGYYALPILRADRIIGWAECTTTGDQVSTEAYLVTGRVTRTLRADLDEETDRLATFLNGCATVDVRD